MCRHSSKPGAGACSQCIGAAVQRVEQCGDTLTIDGIPVRRVEPRIVWSQQTRDQRAKGGKR